MDNKDLLLEIDNAIRTILVGGQSYRLGSRQLTRADLQTLQNMKTTLEIQEQSGNGDLFDNTVVAFFEGR